MWGNVQPAPDYTGTKDIHINLMFKNEDGSGVFVQRVSDNDQPYRWGRAAKALKSSLSDWQYSRMVLQRLKYLDRIINSNTRPEDPDGPCQ